MHRGICVLATVWLMGVAHADPSPNQGLTGDWGVRARAGTSTASTCS